VKVVFDTNIFISAFGIPGGTAEVAYLHAVRGTFELVTSVAILAETTNVLQSKFDWSQEKAALFLQTVSQIATVLKTQPTLHVLRDDPDNRILECALAAQADLVVTGDRHILKLKKFHDTAIVRLADFLRMFPDEPSAS